MSIQMLECNFLYVLFTKQAQSPVTPQVQTGGPKTLFVGNLSFSVEKTDMYVLFTVHLGYSYIQADPDLTFCYSTRENFFKGAGEVVDIRFSFDREGSFRGYGHVEFATVEDALKVHASLSLSLPCLFLSKCEKLPIHS